MCETRVLNGFTLYTRLCTLRFELCYNTPMLSRRLLITLASSIFLISGTALAILWARGYRPDLKNGTIKGTGLLSTNSYPTGAQVFINDELTTATNNTLNLSPGEYQIKIVKDGYLPWEKTLKLEKELVTQTNALLFPIAPDLKALTYTGALDPIPSPDGQKIVFSVASASAQSKNGLYIAELSNRPLSFKAETHQIAQATAFNFNKVDLLWSPDSTQILVYKKSQSSQIITPILLDVNRLNEPPFPDQSAQLSLILADWEEQVKIKTKERLNKLPQKLQEILNQKTNNLYWSPDEEKILYTATASATIPDKLITSLPASNSQPQKRNLESGKIYVYDTKEDRNFLVGAIHELPVQKKEKNQPLTTYNPPGGGQALQLTTLQDQYTPIFIQPIQWFPDSSHLILQEDKIIIEEYDGTNKMTVYAGPLESGNPFVYPWPDGSKLVILATLNKDLPPNLYAINLK